MMKPTEETRRATGRRWSNTASSNLRDKGATPADVGRVLLRRQPPLPPSEKKEK